MVQTIQAKDVTLEELETLFHLQQVEDEQFFREWQDDLPEITDWQKQLLDQVKTGYFNLIKKPPLLEKPVNIAVVSPLLFIGQFFLSPFYLRAEKNVEILAEDEEQGVIVKGNLDTLVLKDQLWVMVIESKQARFSIEAGLAQILAYMLGNPHPEKPSFGMITTGGSFMFVKLVKGETPQYATSDLFGIGNRQNNLYDVLRVLKRLIQLAISSAK
ncbi:MAG TPA: restriction endonuclease subunit R [Cyanobacteria bacterium UBA8553]|nr:restriction endonuclease subunit R [Cyanobacteria bacterium UBA8553]